MRTTKVFQACPVPGEPDDLLAAFRRDPALWLPPPAQLVEPGRWRLSLDAARFSHQVVVDVGPPWQLGEVTWRVLMWEPESADGDALPLDRVLPDFRGEIGLRTGGPPTLVVEGSYAPPLGRLGRGLDAALLHRVADRTVHDLVVTIAKRLRDPASIPS